MTTRTRLFHRYLLMALPLVVMLCGRSAAATAPAEPVAAPPNTPTVTPAPAPPPAAPVVPATPVPPTTGAPTTDPSLPPGPLTLAQAIAIAYQNNGNITIAESNLASSRYR